MSFSAEAKGELCRASLSRACCALAECYGVLLYCHTFHAREIRVITACDAFAARLPKLFRRAFGLTFDVLPPSDAPGKRSFVVTDAAKLAEIFRAFGTEVGDSLVHHINLGVLEEDCCRASFVRGAFLAGGSITDPEKRYHLEVATSHLSVSREMFSLLLELGFDPHESKRGAGSFIYFKQSDAIADFLTTMGAPVAAMDVMTSKVERDMRNVVTRKVNCDTANADKTVSAAQEQLAAIRRIERERGLDTLPEALQQAALLRIANPEASLTDLSVLSDPPASRSCLGHRLKRLICMADEA